MMEAKELFVAGAISRDLAMYAKVLSQKRECSCGGQIVLRDRRDDQFHLVCLGCYCESRLPAISLASH
jgi:formylmethanofuran dehydrogenase subunit E